jgi:hypothetical protein
MTHHRELDTTILELERNNPNRAGIPAKFNGRRPQITQQTVSGPPSVAPEASDLHSKQGAYLEWLLNDGAHREPRTEAELARLLNVDIRALMRWKESVEFASEFKNYLRTKYIYELPEIFSALIRRAKNGDVPAIRLCLQLLGMIPGPELKVEASGMTLEEALRINGNNLEPPTWATRITEEDRSTATELRMEPHSP